MRKDTMKQTIIKLNRRRTPVKGWAIFKKSFLLAILILSFLGWSQGLQAQEYPTRPITLLISYAPGAATDVCARMIAQGATKILGQEIIPVNKPGGGGAVATGILANSKGDGYTLLAVTSASLTNVPHLESVAYDPIKDVVPVIQFGSLITAIIVRSDSPHQSFKDLIDFSRKNPGKVSYGVPGVGITPHLAMELVMLEENVNIVTVPFGGSTPAVTALLGGHVSAVGSSTSGFLAHLKAGKVRALATTADKRIGVLPDTPTLLELGYPNSVLIEMYLIVAPKGTPPAVLKRLEEGFRKAMETPEFRTLAENLYCYAENPIAGQNLKEYIEKEYAKNGEIIRRAKLGK
jgi:tripartite-type tricarboxylate transporter receptor subunit TctC